MSETLIHPTAIVSKKARLGAGVSVGPFSIIYDDVEIGDETEIRSNVLISDGARIGAQCRLFAGAVISTEPQDLKYRGEKTFVHIGDRTTIREYATINRGTSETHKTVVGADCLIMEYCHVAHDCRIGDNVIMSNLTQLGGHVTVHDWVILGGVVKVHQFCTVGAHSFIGADCKIVKDVAPFLLIGREPPKVEGVNKIGLRRRGFSKDTIGEIELFYDKVLFSGKNTKDGIANYLEGREACAETKLCIEFIESSSRGIYR